MSDSENRKYGLSRRGLLKTGGAAAVTGIAGCTQGGGGGGEETPTADETMAATTATGTPEDQEVTVEFWPAWGGYYEETFTEMISRFEEKHPDINVEMTAQGSYRESKSALFNAANAGNPPDIGQLDKGEAVIARDSGFFTPVEDIWPDINPDDYIGSAMGTSIIEGTIWSVPWNNSQIVMYYNKDHFEEAGLDPEQPPDNWDQFANAANTIVDEGVADFGVTWPNHSWWIHSWMSELEAFVCNQENGNTGEPDKVFYDGAAARQVFGFWMNDIGDAYHNPGQENWGASEQAFQNGVASMHMNSSGSIAYSLPGFEENDINVGVTGLPVPGERIGHPMGGAAVWVSDKDRTEAERAGIRTFLEEMTGPELQAYYSKQTGYFASHQGSFDVLEAQGFYEENADTFAQARDQLMAWEATPYNKGILMGPFSKITKEIAVQSDQILQGKSIDEGLSALKDFGDRQLERYQRT